MRLFATSVPSRTPSTLTARGTFDVLTWGGLSPTIDTHTLVEQEHAMAFFQDPPEQSNLYVVDHALKAELKRRLPAPVLARAEPAFEALGHATATTLPVLHEAAESEPPVHVPYNAWGVRTDEIKTSQAWDALKNFSAEHGIVATGYDESYGDRRRIVQAGLIHLFSASSAIYSCPLAMTDAAARVLLDVAPASARERLVSRLLSRDGASFITSGQWMTERAGGSDVGFTDTIARPIGRNGEEDRYTLHGVKWFTSATTSEMALTLARIDDGSAPMTAGSRGLTLFLVEVNRVPGAGYDGIVVNRLKDKLGTRALPTAELTLDGVKATRLGEIGRGVPEIATMLNITRLHNALASASGMVKAWSLAKAYAAKRHAFGKNVIDHPLQSRMLDELEAIAGGATALAFEVADLYGRSEAGTLDDESKRRLRALVPITKLTTGKQAVKVASEALEAFGGAGYVEDTGIPRLLRDAQVLPIWEGTTNVLSLDVLRAESKENAFSSLTRHLAGRVESWPEAVAPKARVVVQKALARVAVQSRAAMADGSIESIARPLSLTVGRLLQATLLAEACAFATDDGERRVHAFVKSELAGALELV
jgi:alkylation response protein AidB-like acyl-CoA dehydrogenase